MPGWPGFSSQPARLILTAPRKAVATIEVMTGGLMNGTRNALVLFVLLLVTVAAFIGASHHATIGGESAGAQPVQRRLPVPLELHDLRAEGAEQVGVASRQSFPFLRRRLVGSQGAELHADAAIRCRGRPRGRRCRGLLRGGRRRRCRVRRSGRSRGGRDQ